jgi:hypothetical protein
VHREDSTAFSLEDQLQSLGPWRAYLNVALFGFCVVSPSMICCSLNNSLADIFKMVRKDPLL